MNNPYVNFRDIKQVASMTAVLEHYRIQLRQINDHTLRGPCPIPAHSSARSTQSFSVHTGRNVWACHSNSCCASRRGRTGGDVIDFVAAMESCPCHEAALKLHAWFVSLRTPNPQALVERQKTVGRQLEEANLPLPVTLGGIDFSHPYLQQRGISEEIARAFGVGFFRGRGFMNRRIVIPLHNKEGKLLAYAGRSIDDSEPRYRFPKGFRKSHVLFNLHRVESDEVIIVEGFFDCLKVWQSPNPSVVALMGCSLSLHQERLLLPDFKKITLLLDSDLAGRKGAIAIAARLSHKVQIRIVYLSDGAQPDQLSSEEINRILIV